MSTIDLGEVRKEAEFYAATGGVINDPFWHSLEERRSIDPARFDAHHPNIAGYFVAPPVLGMQPDGPVLDDLRRRNDLDHARFAHYHPVFGRLLNLEKDVLRVHTPPPTLPPRNDTGCGSGAVPEPGSLALGVAALLFVSLVCLVRKRL